jgi:FkbM family methyltransferase
MQCFFILLFSLKNIYLVSRVASRIVLGKKKRDRLYIEKGISFQNFLYKYIKFLGMDYLAAKIDVPKYGFQAYCRSEDNFKDFIVMTQHEHDLIKRFCPKEGDVVVDIGAHIGLYTIIASKRVGPNGKVVAIEADPSVLNILNKNIKLNNLTNVTPVNNIVYSKEMELGLAEYNKMFSDGDGKSETKDKTKVVHVNTLDNLLQQNEIKEINWIKIDVEGAELEVLKGAHNIYQIAKIFQSS